MYKYQREFIKMVNGMLGYKAFRRDDFVDFLICVPQEDKVRFYEEYRTMKGWSEEEMSRKLF